MRCRHFGFPALALVMLLVLAGSASAQTAITGQVVDGQTMAPLSQAQVQLVGRGGSTGVLTDAQGNFRLDVSPGNYSIVVVLIGYETARVDGVSVSSGETEKLEITMLSNALALSGISVTVSPGVAVATDVAPATVNIVTAEEISLIAAPTPTSYVQGMPGVDAIQTGITQSNTVTRGFNNVFSGSLLVLTDYRYARVPSLRLNAYNMVPSTPLDVERVEVVLGPASALYGPNSANGVMHIITTSPITKPGSSFSIAGGSREIFQGVFRQAWKFSEKAGLKISGQYFTGNDFEYFDPAEVATSTNPLIANRDFNTERFGGEARLDLRPWDDPNDDIIFTYGRNQLGSSVELTGIGAAQVKDWVYQFGQVRLRKGRLFAQAFLNKSDAGDTYLLRTGQGIVDKSTMFAGQAQYGWMLGDKIDLVGGVDASKTTPNTEGTITGSNEDMDETTQIGAYLHSTTALSPKVDFVAALRVDKHQQLENPVYSPRAALVFKPVDGHNIRATYNRAFSTPSTNNLFLDLIAGRIPLTPSVGYSIRTFGVPETGFTWNNTCAGGVNNYCMYSPFAPGQQLPATGAALWDAVVVPLALSDPTLLATLPLLGLTPATFAAIVGNPQPGELTSTLLRFNTEDRTVPFVPDPGVSAVGRIRPTITTTFEGGYNGLIADRFKVTADVYASQIKDFVGPLRVETPSVFLDGNSVAAYIVSRLSAVGIPAAVAGQIAAGIAPNVARVPLGTVAPDQRSNSDMLLTYRNFGDVNLWGADLGFEFLATDKWSFTGSYSYVSEECFDFNNDGDCAGAADVALNAPTNKGTFGARYDNKGAGTVVGFRVRYSDAFPMNSGVYVGTVDSYTVMDVNLAYRVPGYKGFIMSLTLNNAFGNVHREFIGAPEIGRIGLLKVQYAFGGN